MKSPTMHNDADNLDARLARKAAHAADLAVSAYALGNEHEAHAAAYRAGELAYRAGASLDRVARDLPGLVVESGTWSPAVDGWFAAQAA